MMTRDLADFPQYSTWLGLDDAAMPVSRPDMSRGAGAHVTPAAAVARPVGLGMDITDPQTYVRPYNPRPGMFTRLHQEAARGARG